MTEECPPSVTRKTSSGAEWRQCDRTGTVGTVGLPNAVGHNQRFFVPCFQINRIGIVLADKRNCLWRFCYMFRPSWDLTQDVVHTQSGTRHFPLTTSWMAQRVTKQIRVQASSLIFLSRRGHRLLWHFSWFFSVPPRRFQGSACRSQLSPVVLPPTLHIFRFC